MNAAIARMTKSGVKPIADITIEVFIDMLIEKGTVKINNVEHSKEDLQEMYNELSKIAFQNITKHINKSTKTADKPSTKRISGYLLFCSKTRPSLKDEGLGFKEISTRLGEMWADADKDTWNAEAAKLKQVNEVEN